MALEGAAMEFIQPASWSDALAVKAGTPAAVPLAGGTDLMVELNFDARRPETLLDLTRITELTEWDRADGRLRLGAGVTYTRVIYELGRVLPGLAMAARTVGSPQIRNRGTIGGNLGAASPAGDCHPVLLACGAVIEATSVRGTRQIPAADYYTGPKRNALAPDELITAVLIRPATGAQQFAKIGTRNAMVIAVCAFALDLRPPQPDGSIAQSTRSGDVSHAIDPRSDPRSPKRGAVGTGIGSAGPTPLRAVDAEEFLATELAGRWSEPGPLPEPLTRRFGELVAAAARPIDDVRGTAAYRRHALSVLARRTLTWTWNARGDRQCA
jgi:CO/xanthine dehydrogenase FAD-binding subunit